MRKVVDSQCRMYRVKNLRVIDTSIMPLSITAHLQASRYICDCRIGCKSDCISCLLQLLIR